ncbi:hypothetical protein C4552_00470 [Candidatus Parcubacteria bacterium]|nr:MAG: hypothetical protein C4552_00470 [Candidatus Parcubacteria bacterium]
MADDIKRKIEELAALGKDRSEMDLWLGLLPAMTDEELQALSRNISREFALLRPAGADAK